MTKTTSPSDLNDLLSSLSSRVPCEEIERIRSEYTALAAVNEHLRNELMRLRGCEEDEGQVWGLSSDSAEHWRIESQRHFAMSVHLLNALHELVAVLASKEKEEEGKNA